MIKCYFVDVKDISSTVPKSKFKKAAIDRLADAILAADGLLRPLILQETGVEKYTVIEGHREYYAAVRAKEKDITKAEMVNAFIIDANFHKSAIMQLDLLTGSELSSPVVDPTPDPQIFTDLLAESIDRLLPTITASICTQIQPIISQLTEHQQILDTIKLALVNQPQNEGVKEPETEAKISPVTTVNLSEQEVKPVVDLKSTVDRKKKSEPIETLGSDLPEPKPAKVTKTTPKSSKKNKPADKLSASIPVEIEPQTQIGAAIPSTTIAKSVETNRTATGGSIELDRSTNALNLINTLSQDDLKLKMERSSVLPAIVKLIPKIILQRNSQPAQKFDTWEDLIKAKIAGLTSAKVQDIIKKLK
jgi:ParB-like nuclease domain